MTQKRSLEETILDEVLPRVQKPGQYAGGERNVVIKDPASVDLRVALAFPDTYAIGMSHLGMKILYHLINRRENTAAERVFTPWPDMEAELRRRELPLISLESFSPLGDFDVVGFSIQYELGFTNLLNMLQLGGIPLRAADRTGSDPVILAGGSISSALEPVAPFLDAVLVGDAEDVLDDILDTIIAWKKQFFSREELYDRLAVLPGLYVPSKYEVSYSDEGPISRILHHDPAPAVVHKTTVRDLESAPFPTAPVVPNVEVVHDRINIEIMRGCPHLCRFCQANQHYRPIKIRAVDTILRLCRETFNQTGYEEISLSSLSTADYPDIDRLIAAILKEFGPLKVNVSLPSLRVSEQLKLLPELAATVRKAGLTMAPEVGSDRLRTIIRKKLHNSDLLAACEAAYRAGYRLLKFYFMIGLPTETAEDLQAIYDLIDEASLLRKRVSRQRAQINAAISSFVPKPHTPFQWEPMLPRQQLKDKQAFLLARKRAGQLRLKFHDVEVSYLEAVFSRGDRRLAGTLEKALERGIRLDAWTEHFDIQAWQEVFEDCGVDPDFYALRERAPSEILPWDMIQLDMPRSYLLKEFERSRA